MKRYDDMKEFSSLTQISQFTSPINPNYNDRKRTIKASFEVKKTLTNAWNGLFE